MTTKNFDEWNEEKKETHFKLKSKWVREREVWWCILGVNVGTEEDGKNEWFTRPVIVMRVFGNESALVVPLTSRDRGSGKFYFHLGIIGDTELNSTALLTHIRSVDTRRCTRKIGKVNGVTFTELKKAIRNFFE